MELKPTNITEYERTDVSYQITFTEDGAPVDLTGCEIYFTVKDHWNKPDSAALIKVDVSNVPDPHLGIAVLEIPYAQTEGVTGELYYDIKFKNNSDKVQRLAHGKITFIASITQRDE